MSDAVVAPATEARPPASGVAQLALLTRRFAWLTLRNPAVPLNLALAIFYLIIYDGTLGGSEAIVKLTGGNYYNFILPVAILAASVAGGAAGLALVSDLESGYFRRQLTMPVSRGAIVGAAMLMGALQVVLQTVVVLGVGLLLGADPKAGAGGLAVLILIALVWGLGFAGYSVAVGLLTGDAQVTQAAGLIFLPLIFLSPVFVPASELKGWVQSLSSVNPTRYVLEGMRSLLIDGWDGGQLLAAALAGGGFTVVMVSWGVYTARRFTAQD